MGARAPADEAVRRHALRQRRPRAGPRHADPRVHVPARPRRPRGADHRRRRAPRGAAPARAAARGRQGALHGVAAATSSARCRSRAPTSTSSGSRAGWPATSSPAASTAILAAGRPVIAAAEAESETAQLVARVGCGVVVPPGDPFALARAIRAAHDGEYDLAEMGRRARDVRGGRGRPRDRDRPLRRRCSRELQAARDRVEVVFWASLGGARLDARRVSARRRARRARPPASGARGQTRRPSVTVIVAAYNEETVIERRLENLLALDYPADRLEIVVTSDASTDRTDELVEAVAAREPRVRLIRCPRGGKVAAQDRAVRETQRRDRRLLRRERDLGAGHAREARPLVRRSRRRVRLRPARAHRRRRLEPRGRLLALRDLAARAGVGARLGHRRERLDLRRAPLRLRRGRPALRPRPLAAVPDGAARPAGRLRPGGARVRAADAGDRDRVPAQGAHVRALLADRAARAGCCAACRPATSSRSSRTATCATAAACCTSSLLGTNVALVAMRAGLRLRRRARAPARVPRCSPLRGAGCRATTRSSPGRPSSRSGTTCAAACPRPGTRPRGRAEDGRSRSTSTSAQSLVKTHGNLYRGAAADPLPDPAVPARAGRRPDAARPRLQLGPLDDRRRARRATARPGSTRAQKAVEAARRVAAQLGVEAEYVVGDARELPFPDDSFDVVFSYSVLQHLAKDDVRRVIAEIRRVLRPGGTAWIEMPNAHGPLNLVRQARARLLGGQRPGRPLLDARRAARGVRRDRPGRALGRRVPDDQPAAVRPRPAAAALARRRPRLGVAAPGLAARAVPRPRRGQRRRPRAGGRVVNRAARRRAGARSASSLTSPFLGRRRARGQARGRRAGPLPADAGSGKDGAEFELLKLRTMVVGAEKHGRRLRGRPRATRGSRAPGGSCGGSRSTSCRSSGTSSAAT